MIVTLTPNPSIDRTITVPELMHGEVHRATDSRIDPGGKGINVTRALTANGTESIAVLPSGGPEGRLMDVLLEDAGVSRRAVPVAGVLRMNIAVVEPDGTTTKINEPGPRLSPQELDAVFEATIDQLGSGATWLVGCGSLPPGVDDDFYAELIRRARYAGARVAIDTSGTPLTKAVTAGPDLIKPNQEELEELVGGTLRTLGDVRDAAAQLNAGGIGTVVVSLGRHGALLVTGQEVAHAKATVGRPLSTVGAGDSLLAGFLHALSRGDSASDALATGSAWGGAAVSLPGSRMPTPSDVAAVPVTLTATPDFMMSIS